MPGSGTASRKLANGARRAVRHPTWLSATLRSSLRARVDRRRSFSLDDYSAYRCSVEEALAGALGLAPADAAALVERVQAPPRHSYSRWGGGRDILTLTGALVLHRRPAVVIETGVAMGYTTAVILAAMHANQRGHLHSIDLPPLQVDAREFVGQVVAEGLRDRWTLHRGPARSLLPELARRSSPIDLFVHDSDHSYAGQREELRIAWPHLADGGCIVVDDVANSAFTDFAATTGARPYLIAPRGQRAAVGLLVKPEPARTGSA